MISLFKTDNFSKEERKAAHFFEIQSQSKSCPYSLVQNKTKQICLPASIIVHIDESTRKTKRPRMQLEIIPRRLLLGLYPSLAMCISILHPSPCIGDSQRNRRGEIFSSPLRVAPILFSGPCRRAGALYIAFPQSTDADIRSAAGIACKFATAWWI